MAGKFIAGDTSRGLVVHKGRLLLMERWRDDLHYFSIPGGHIEPGENALQTVVREIAEETTLMVVPHQEVLQMHDGDIVHHIYLCEYVSGEPMMPDTAPEMQSGSNNIFKPGWCMLEDIPQLPFVYWQPLKQALIEGLANNFANGLVIVSKD